MNLAVFRFVIACVLAVGLQVIFFSLISPEILEFPPASSRVIPPSNRKLQEEVIKLGEGFLVKPKDVCVDKRGLIYTVTRDGWIKLLHKNGKWENWKWFDSETLLGMTAALVGSIIVCDIDKGILKFTDEGITLLSLHVDGVKIRFSDDVIETYYESLYFSDASTRGRLLKYDPSLNETSILMDQHAFANGVALYPDQDFLIVNESWK